jgi:hypothetical protein
MSTTTQSAETKVTDREVEEARRNIEPQPTNAEKSSDQLRGVLSVQVNALPIVAGTRATVTLLIRNPFPQEVVIE